jgi:hypothetical protein
MHWRQGLAAFGSAALNWLCDALCLWTVLQAFDVSIPFRNLALLYAAAVAAAGIGVTPAGIGTVEVAIALAVSNLGGHGSHALLAAITYRAISTWAVLLIGWAVLAARRGGDRGASGRFDGPTIDRTKRRGIIPDQPRSVPRLVAATECGVRRPGEIADAHRPQAPPATTA